MACFPSEGGLLCDPKWGGLNKRRRISLRSFLRLGPVCSLPSPQSPNEKSRPWGTAPCLFICGEGGIAAAIPKWGRLKQMAEGSRYARFSVWVLSAHYHRVSPLTKKAVLGGRLLLYLFAVRAGFEPAVPLSEYAGLANRWFQPLTHLTSFVMASLKGCQR